MEFKVMKNWLGLVGSTHCEFVKEADCRRGIMLVCPLRIFNVSDLNKKGKSVLNDLSRRL